MKAMVTAAVVVAELEMLMVRKPCNCKIRLSHIKQIAIANQTSVVVRSSLSEQMVIIMAGI